MGELKKILVTGGSGKAGRYVVAELLAHGYTVINCDRRPSTQVRTYQADLTDLGQVFAMVEGMDAMIHLAAIPWPGEHAPEVVFRNNTMSTFNILQAAAVLGVRRIALASSESALGFPFKVQPITPHYLPIDEDHPLLAQDAYGLSKIVGEEVAAGFARRDPTTSIVSLRFSYIIEPDDFDEEVRRANLDLQQNSFNLWAYVDVRDVAIACRLAVESAPVGHHPLYIAAPDTLLHTPTRDAVRQLFPDIARLSPDFGGRMSPLALDRAARTIGFRAQYRWDAPSDA
jgi:nucleoside-diphosphate-sugar epimerase